MLRRRKSKEAISSHARSGRCSCHFLISMAEREKPPRGEGFPRRVTWQRTRRFLRGRCPGRPSGANPFSSTDARFSAFCYSWWALSSVTLSQPPGQRCQEVYNGPQDRITVPSLHCKRWFRSSKLKFTWWWLVTGELNCWLCKQT